MVRAMTDRACRNCRYYLPENSAGGDCLSMMSGRTLTKAGDACGMFTVGKSTIDFALNELPADFGSGEI